MRIKEFKRKLASSYMQIISHCLEIVDLERLFSIVKVRKGFTVNAKFKTYATQIDKSFSCIELIVIGNDLFSSTVTQSVGWQNELVKIIISAYSIKLHYNNTWSDVDKNAFFTNLEYFTKLECVYFCFVKNFQFNIFFR